MFPVTRPNRQAAATIALVLLTILPTVYVAWTAWKIRRPGHLREVERQIVQALGLPATLEAVRYPRPGEVVYQGVVLWHEEPRNKGLIGVARARSLRLRRSDRELALDAEGLTLHAESPRAAMAQVGALLQRSVDPSYDRISLSALECELDLGAGVAPYRLREVVGIFNADPSAPGVRASYRVAGQGASTRCELTLTRDRKAEPVRTTVVLKTMEGLPLPARVLDPFFDAADWLGPDARVEGALTLSQEGTKDWEAEFQGSLLDIDLSEMVGRRFPNHRLSGKARLAIASARWSERPGQGYGWVEAQGELSAGPGVIGSELLHALSAEMKFRIGPRGSTTVPPGEDDIDFRALNVAFSMSRDGQIKIKGGLGSQFASDVVLLGPTAPLAFAPPGPANVRGLIKALFPVTAGNHAEMVPLTEKSRLLLHLPVPPDVAARPTVVK